MHNFSREYFFAETTRFRKMMGDKTIMADEEKRDAALNAYTFLYLNLAEVDDLAETVFVSTTEEFSQRCALMIFS